MKLTIVLAVVSCFILSVSAQNCVQRASQITTCTTRLASGGTGAFCNECGNTLIRYYQDCVAGLGVDAVKQSQLNSQICRISCVDTTCAQFLQIRVLIVSNDNHSRTKNLMS